MPPEWERAFADLAQRQEGLVGFFQLTDLGCTADQWWRARRSRRWEPLSDRVLRSAASARSDAQRVLAGVLDASPGAVLHGRCALAWVDIGPYNLSRLLVARPRGASGRGAHLAHVHRLRALRAQDVTVIRGVATETALRAIWTVAADYSSERRFEAGLDKIGHLLDDANRRGLLTWAALHEMLDDLQRCGRAGTRIMRELARTRPPGSSPTESRLEFRFEKILEDGDIRPFARQVHLGGHEPIGRFDQRDERLPLAVEINSTTFHTLPTDQASDERRYQALTNAGFTVAVIWEDDIWYRPQAVIDTIHEARRLAAAGIRAVIHSPSCPWPDPRLGARP